MDDPTSDKKRAPVDGASQPIKANNQTMRTHEPELETLILNLSLPWLSLTDEARCSQVCKSWRDGFEPPFWKQTAQNANPVAFSELAKSVGHRFTSKQLASGLVKIRQVGQATPPHLPLPEPTMRPEDIYFLLEVNVVDSKCAWCQCLAESPFNSFQQLTFQKPTEASMKTIEFVADNFFDCLNRICSSQATLSVWRADSRHVASLTGEAKVHLSVCFPGITTSSAPKAPTRHTEVFLTFTQQVPKIKEESEGNADIYCFEAQAESVRFYGLPPDLKAYLQMLETLEWK